MCYYPITQQREGPVQTLDRLSSSEAAATSVLALANACYFSVQASARPPSRRVAGVVLALVNLGLAAEALLYLAVLPETGSDFEAAAVFTVRSLLMLGTLSISVLIARQLGRRRG
jgi:hypothetical protein